MDTLSLDEQLDRLEHERRLRLAGTWRTRSEALVRKYRGVPGEALLASPTPGRSRALDRRLAREKKLSKNHGRSDAHRARRDDQRRTMY